MTEGKDGVEEQDTLRLEKGRINVRKRREREKRKGERMGCDNDGEETVEGDENEMISGRGEERNREEKENFRGRDGLWENGGKGEGDERGEGWTVWQRKRGRDES